MSSRNDNSPKKTNAHKPKAPYTRQYEETVEFDAKLGIIPILTRLGEASNKENQATRANELDALIGRLEDFREELRFSLLDHVRDVFEAAVDSREKLLRVAIDVAAKWMPVVRASIVLAELNRPKEFGDGRKAFQIFSVVIPEIFKVYGGFGNGPEADFSLINYLSRSLGEELIYEVWITVAEAARTAKLSPKELDAIEEERKISFKRFVQITTKPFEQAVWKAREDGGRDGELRCIAQVLADFLTKACLNGSYNDGYASAADDLGFGLGIWSGARDELDSWVCESD
ncbi:hypothetical protein M407DRAFT_24970 [Tulasnella calospora MUT 4182]|uniref:Uncharacterized protein n=1 Tax=Tulasnella calospora MUT 4182 TaxID=1051891 RepID=A0A0C3QGY6_9AGAM|nr:hypothetical protein M407DRAFT_24970 [Tulasnella calospora MUT 4182]